MKNWNQNRSTRLLQEQQKRQLEIFDATSDLVATTDIDGFLISLNIAGYKLLEIQMNTDITKLRLASFYTNESASNFLNVELPNAIEHSVWHSETMLRATSGNEIISSQVLVSHRNEQDNIDFFSVILRDIRHLKAAEAERENLIEQLHHAKKMETIGRLAGGFAHDFNNILTIIIGYAELGLLNLEANEFATEELEIILDSSQKAARLSNQLLSFSNSQMIEPQILDLNEIINHSEQLIKSLLGGNIELIVNLAENLWPVHVDHSQMEQAILNMAVNARDAIKTSGEFKLETNNLSLSKQEAQSQGLGQAGDYVKFSLSDTGYGIKPEAIEHIFEPFYTTKIGGKGDGLGLTSVYGAVKQSSGHITVISEINKGTQFNIYFKKASSL